MKIGAHISIKGGINEAVIQAKASGLSVMQIFASAPQNWQPPKISDQEAKQFALQCQKEQIKLFLHSIYLINLASKNPYIYNHSINSLIVYLDVSVKLGAAGVIFHIGSSKDRSFDEVKEKVVDRINQILAKSDPKSVLIVENSAGAGSVIGDNFSEISEIITGIQEKSRLGVCLDTAHLFASGYDILGRGSKAIFREFDQKIGLKYLKAIHLNDSRSEFDSHVDRHEDIGQGKLGEKFFKDFLAIPEIKKVPLILEVPGDLESNIKRLKELSK